MRWTGSVTCRGVDVKMYEVLVEKPEGKNHFEDQGIDGKLESEWILGRLAGVV
jgi:hypothetical protein